MYAMLTQWVGSLRSKAAASGLIRPLHEMDVAWRESKALDYIHSVLDDFRSVDAIVGWSVQLRDNLVPNSYLTIVIVTTAAASRTSRFQVMRSLRDVNARFRTNITARFTDEHAASIESTAPLEAAAHVG
ncbi:MAG TPA: hypothetical protein VK470_07775 [Bacteroidota bacterium]|nr:hypothetical protein [Bacteroidota bacterium]